MRQRRLLLSLGLAGAVLPIGLWSCPLRQLTGIPCPTCYLSRSVLATLRGDIPQALEWHALGPVLVALALGLGIWTVFGGGLQGRRLLQLACAVAVLAFGYWLLRLWGWSQGQPLPA